MPHVFLTDHPACDAVAAWLGARGVRVSRERGGQGPGSSGLTLETLGAPVGYDNVGSLGETDEAAGLPSEVTRRDWWAPCVARVRRQTLALDRLHGAAPLDLVVLHEEFTPSYRPIVLWAKARGVPSLHVPHAAWLWEGPALETWPFASLIADYQVYPSRRVLDRQVGYAPGPLPKGRVTGNPAFDGYASFAEEMATMRASVRRRLGLPAGAWVVAFLSSEVWKGNPAWKLIDGDVQSVYAAFLRVMLGRRSEGWVPVLKPYPAPDLSGHRSRHRETEQRVDAVAPVEWTGRLSDLLPALDAVVAYGSTNAVIECVMAGVSVVAIRGFAGEPGLREADDTPESIERALTFARSEEGRGTLAAAREAFLEAHNDGPPGKATDKVGLFILEILEKRTRTHQTPPPSYYNTPRSDLLPLLPERASRILEVGCGGGATGRLLRERYPSARLVGIEADAGAAEAARAVYDLVLQRDVERLGASELLEAAGGPFDLVLYPDVLEHLRDPWAVLREMRECLVNGAVVVASIPNVANVLTIYELRHGRWPYASEGLFDLTHLRFFGRADAVQLFESTGYRVETVHRTTAIPLPRGRWSRWEYVWKTFALRGISEEERRDLETFQFQLVCRPGTEGDPVASRKPGGVAAAGTTPPPSALRRVHQMFLRRSARYSQVARALRLTLVRWGMLDLPDYPGDFIVR